MGTIQGGEWRDPKFLRNLRFSKKWNGKGRGSDE